jgi:hypothetical protein
MYKLNLIRGWQKTGVYKSYRNRILLLLVALAVLLIGAYLFFFVRFVFLQRELTRLSNEQFITTNSDGFSTEELTKTLYSLRKLEQVRAVYSEYPEFYLYHNFLLKKILRNQNLTINNYTLNREHAVDVSVESQKLSELFTLINLLEERETAQYFSLFEVNSIVLSKPKSSAKESYLMDFKLQFNEKLLNEKG